ncbi:MAG TPA: XRE family transcriptional regulator [Pyrinomonadaceae bacterium]|nr:XRE family transcriptional regulator [Pyrinomonadaceae bacterium]
MNRFNINVNPQVLRWAREEAGFDMAEIAQKINISIDEYKHWEKEGENIPFSKLKTIAGQYKRQIAVFFLPKVPEKISKPIDFRNLSPQQRKLSKHVLMVMRDVTYFRQTALELKGETYWKSRYDWLKNIKNIKQDNLALSDWLRDKLDISVETQFSWKYDSQAFKHWRQAVEDKLGILVFQFSMPLDEVQGFCYTDNYPYSIVVNSKHSYTSRLFTIFHELGHIVRHHSGMCLIDNIEEKQHEEFSCNSFAGNFLIPEDYLIATNDLLEIQKYSNLFRVSREAYLRQLKEKNKIHPTKFFTLLSEIKSTYVTKAKSSGFVLPEVKSRASRGETFFNLVLDSLNQNKISYTQASALLDLRISKVLNEA